MSNDATPQKNAMVVGDKVRHGELEITVTRADGTVEKHGIVAYYDRNPLKRLAWRINRSRLGRLLAKRD